MDSCKCKIKWEVMFCNAENDSKEVLKRQTNV